MQVEIKKNCGLIGIEVAGRVLFRGDFGPACDWVANHVSFPEAVLITKRLRCPDVGLIRISPTKVVLNRDEAGGFLDIPPFTVDMLLAKGLLVSVRADGEPKHYTMAALLEYQVEERRVYNRQ